ncbi:hypothetical protein ON010_g12284 [Phytophthora cinnamomi]|nr:hypothetical protein ON010_g12284 [Phytophthora cinnamomi]
MPPRSRCNRSSLLELELLGGRRERRGRGTWRRFAAASTSRSLGMDVERRSSRMPIPPTSEESILDCGGSERRTGRAELEPEDDASRDSELPIVGSFFVESLILTEHFCQRKNSRTTTETRAQKLNAAAATTDAQRRRHKVPTLVEVPSRTARVLPFAHLAVLSSRLLFLVEG